jgi:hypothetical protein
MPLAGLKHAIAAIERPHAYALIRVATEIGNSKANFQPVASRYTNKAIPAHTINI